MGSPTLYEFTVVSNERAAEGIWRLTIGSDVAGSIRSAVSAENTFSAFAERSDFELSASLKNTVYNSCSFCNYFLTDENHLFIVLGESVGKSLPSMLMSMLAATNICALAKMGVEPHKIAYETNNSLCGFERNDIGMTVSALIARLKSSSRPAGIWMSTSSSSSAVSCRYRSR